MQADYLFVYGTLRRGSPHPMQQLPASNSRYCGKSRFRGRRYELEGYPGVVPSADPQDRVQGDLLQLASPGLLEQYEQAGPAAAQPSKYRRQRVRVESEPAGQLDAWIYLYNRPLKRQRQIRSGDYLSDNEPRKTP